MKPSASANRKPASSGLFIARDLVAGSKGGGSTKTPTEAPDSLRSLSTFAIDDLISEGEIGGLVNGLQSVYLNNTPVANADGTLNFTGVTVDQRTGTQDQSYIPGFTSVQNEVSVGVELKDTIPWVQSITETDLSAVRITLAVQSLEQTDTSTGNITGYMIQYAIDVATDGATYQTVLTSAFNGKTTDEYEKSHRIDLPKATTGWSVRLRRITPNANSATIADTTTMVSYTEIIDVKLRYPNSAHIGITGDATQFSSIPTRSYDCWGRIISVPSNWDPTTRVYSGVWDGTFKPAWTDNPAWVFYDAYTQDRFGLGDIIESSLVDKWSLYQIAQYCDGLVSDGKGGKEPRFTCNAYIQTAEDAYKLMGDIASIFRGIAYWMSGSITASADMPADPVYTYTQANVINGTFTYQSSARNTRYTTALVTWNDPTNFYNQAVEYVESQAGLARYGIQETDFVAFGCTSQGQAHRAGQWALLTSQLETDSVTFSVGLDGVLAAPGQIINVQDASRAGARQGGRISLATTNSVTVDRAPDAVAIGDTLTVILPTGVAETRTISAVAGRLLTVSSDFTDIPTGQSVWAVGSATLALQTFRVTSVSEDTSDTGISFTISAVQHVAGIFANIDDGTIIQIAPISRLPASLQAPPTNVTVSGHVVTTQGIATNVMTIAWAAAKDANNYQVEWQKDNGQWIQAGTVATLSLDVQGIYTGSYIARVTALSGTNSSLPALSAATQIAGKTGAPPTLTSLTAKSLVFGIQLDWGFPEVGATDTQRTEIWQSLVDDLTTAVKLGDFAYPQNMTQLLGLAAGASIFFWGRLVDKTGNIGAWYPATAGVNGQSSSDATEILTYLSGQISKTQLAQDLLSEIDTATDAAAQLAQYLDAPAYDATAVYKADDIISDGGHFYRATVAVPAGNEPPNPTYWQDVGETTQTAYSQAANIYDVNAHLSAVDEAQQATAAKTDGIYVQITPNGAGDAAWGAGDSTIYAGTITAQSVAANDNLATATLVTTIEASVDDAVASVQTNAEAVSNLNGVISASYNIKTQVAANGQTYYAGIAIGVDQSGGTVSSQVLVNAATFAVFDASSTGSVGTAPFVIQGGQTFINQALIGTGWITNAMIGNTIQSTALNAAGQPTWVIDKSGTITLNGDAFVITHSSTGTVMKTSTGATVLEMGVLS